MSKISSLIKNKFSDFEFRQSFVQGNIFSSLAHQIEIMRTDRNLSQSELAELMNTSQSVVSRLENPGYGKYTLTTLFQLARAFDVGLEIRFVPWSKLLRNADEWSPKDDAVKAFDVHELQEHFPVTILPEPIQIDDQSTPKFVIKLTPLQSSDSSFMRIVNYV